jgi:hypothetical protein
MRNLFLSLSPHTFFNSKSFVQQHQAFYLCFGALGASFGAFFARGRLWAAKTWLWAALSLVSSLLYCFSSNKGF